MRKITTSEAIGDPVLVKVGDPHAVIGMPVVFNSVGASHLIYETGVLRFVTSGCLTFQLAAQLVLLPEDKLIYFPPKSAQKISCVGPSASSWQISIPSEAIVGLPKTPSVIETSNLLIALCERIVSWGVGRKDRDSAVQNRLVATFYDELEMAKVVQEPQLPYPSTRRLRLAADRIINGPGDRASVAAWAKVCGMSLRSFSALFAKETGMPFATWRQFVRLQAAVKMLGQNQSVAKIAADLGYPSSSAFVEVFRKQFGMPPKQYARMMLQKVSATVVAIGAPYLMKMGVQLSYLLV